ncbi:hypothetical protein ACFL96_00070 [Thermoproteota archaeon]
MNLKRVIITGIAVWFLGSIGAFITCGGLFNWVYQLPPNIWRTNAEIMTSSTMIWTNVIGIIIALLFAFVFAVVYKGVPGKGLKKGITYGLLVWLVGPIAGIPTMPFYMTISNTVIIYWLIQSFVFHLIYGAAAGLLYKPE